MFYLLIESVLLEFDHYLEIYTFPTLQNQFKPQEDWDEVQMDQLYVLLSA
jgi:hypothetical protein